MIKDSLRRYGTYVAILLGLISLMALVACSTRADALLRDSVEIIKSDGSSQVFNVELAMNSDDHARGLMFRTYLPEENGMLFLFGSVRKRSFWMRNTLIPLDIIFIGSDGVIHHIHSHAKPQDNTSITSEHAVKAVLEINGGLSDKLGISVGDKVLHPVFNNIVGKETLAE